MWTLGGLVIMCLWYRVVNLLFGSCVSVNLNEVQIRYMQWWLSLPPLLFPSPNAPLNLLPLILIPLSLSLFLVVFCSAFLMLLSFLFSHILLLFISFSLNYSLSGFIPTYIYLSVSLSIWLSIFSFPFVLIQREENNKCRIEFLKHDVVAKYKRISLTFLLIMTLSFLQHSAKEI